MIIQYLCKQEEYCFLAHSVGHGKKTFISFLQHCLAVIWHSVALGDGARADAGALPILPRGWVVCSGKAVILSSLQCQQGG